MDQEGDHCCEPYKSILNFALVPPLVFNQVLLKISAYFSCGEGIRQGFILL